MLEALRPVRYLGVDISREFLRESTRCLADDYPWLEVHAIHADFCQRVALPPGVPCERPVAFFPGSSIGNFAPWEAQDFLRGLHGLLPAGGGLLVGVDLIKDARILDAAYNDAAGLTAAFNRNLLLRMRDEFEGDLDPQRFMHRAFYNAAESRVEMHLVSADEQRISVAGEQFHFSSGETLHTENSYKYSVAGFQTLAAHAAWTDRDALFSLHYLERA
ncbi:L-histidine N(alpha)-methyltransferase [Modicisalibacter radicis]|uniref:L-histidine N(alpha)-methyltransferase n=1 Tax=Halomonas sp. EAR18 TaxID=2518972 RepID=UPI002452E278|nr:L-histidine N(alpha)-methyltransferase [Halomonas sp. EAR18]